MLVIWYTPPACGGRMRLLLKWGEFLADDPNGHHDHRIG